MTFKKLVALIAQMENRNDFNAACSEVDRSFQSGRITWNDHEILYDLLGKIGRGNGYCI